MKLPMDPGGSGSGVGGDTETIEAGARTLSQEAGKIAPAAQQVTTAGTTASGAVGDPGAADAVTTFATAWSQFTTDFAGHLRALSTLAQTGSEDLRAATGGPAGGSLPTSAPGVTPGSYFPGAYKPGQWPKNLNPRFPGMPPGWQFPMRRDYVPTGNNPLTLPVTTTTGPR